MIKAVIFDVDGTLVDSEPLHVLAWDKALRFYDFSLEDLSEGLQNSIAGRKPLKNAEDMVEELHLSIDAETLLKQKTDIFMDLLRSDLHGMPGLTVCLEGLKKDGYRLAIGTSQVDPYITLALDGLLIKDYFEVIVMGSEITNGKPHPETYLTVIKKLGLDPEECIVVEDATTGITSAKAAGCLCIAIENHKAKRQDTSLADKVITSLDEITDSYIKKTN
ncbi:MAG: HAD family phosphatase [Candidatus Levybacteria bacterium]|nr:HAD family phosphatase [Candidatus Levybacteria bacterium]